MSFGEQIKKFREGKNWRQNELAQKLGVSNKTISGWESGNKVPNIDTLVEIAVLLDISLEELFEVKFKKAKEKFKNLD